MIGEDIEIVITGIKSQSNRQPSVQLGIEAPKHIQVDREEIRAKKEIFKDD